MNTKITRREFITTTALGTVGVLTTAATVTLQWNSVAEADGYKIYWGTASHTYNGTATHPVTSGTINSPYDVGNNTSGVIVLNPGTYYFAVTAYNNYGESGYSEELPCTIESIDPGHIHNIHLLTFNVPPPPGGSESVFVLNIYSKT